MALLWLSLGLLSKETRNAQGSARHGMTGIKMKVQEWRPRNGASGMRASEWSLGNEGLGMESRGMEHRYNDMSSDDPPVWGHERTVYTELRSPLLLIIIESILHSFRLLTVIIS